jgi:L-amino acid N-acyltransferase YncA
VVESLQLKVEGEARVNYLIEPLRASDWEAVRAIFLEGIASGNATFETAAPTWEKWDSAHLAFGRLVARSQDSVLGWAALSPVSSRCVYAGVAEVSIYVAAHCRGQGIGKALLQALIDEAEQHGIWTLQAGVFPENPASVALTRQCGFREVGRREKLGKLAGVWRDVLLLERRSRIVGA